MSLEELVSAHRAVAEQTQELYAQRAALIRRARSDGHTWPEIADALGMTVHGAIKASRMNEETP